MINEIKNYCNRINARLPRIINNIDAIFNRLTDSCKNTIPIILINNIPKEHQIA